MFVPNSNWGFDLDVGFNLGITWLSYWIACWLPVRQISFQPNTKTSSLVARAALHNTTSLLTASLGALYLLRVNGALASAFVDTGLPPVASSLIGLALVTASTWLWTGVLPTLAEWASMGKSYYKLLMCAFLGLTFVYLHVFTIGALPGYLSAKAAATVRMGQKQTSHQKELVFQEVQALSSLACGRLISINASRPLSEARLNALASWNINIGNAQTCITSMRRLDASSIQSLLVSIGLKAISAPTVASPTNFSTGGISPDAVPLPATMGEFLLNAFSSPYPHIKLCYSLEVWTSWLLLIEALLTMSWLLNLVFNLKAELGSGASE